MEMWLSAYKTRNISETWQHNIGLVKVINCLYSHRRSAYRLRGANVYDLE